MLLIVAFVFTTASVNAQFKIGAKAGFTMSQFQPNSDLSLKTGYTFGTMVDIKIVPFLRVQPEFTYYQKGASFKTYLNGVNYLRKTTINYLHIPINLKLNIPIIPVYLIAGPYVSYGLSGTNYSKLGEIVTIDNVAVDFGYKNSFQTRPFDFGINFGTGYHKDILAGLITLFAEVRFDVGLLDTDNDNGENSITKNQNVAINLGVLFGL